MLVTILEAGSHKHLAPTFLATGTSGRQDGPQKVFSPSLLPMMPCQVRLWGIKKSLHCGDFLSGGLPSPRYCARGQWKTHPGIPRSLLVQQSKASGQHSEYNIKRYRKTAGGGHFSTDTDVENINIILSVFLQHVMLSTNVPKQLCT